MKPHDLLRKRVRELRDDLADYDEPTVSRETLLLRLGVILREHDAAMEDEHRAAQHDYDEARETAGWEP